MKRLVTLLALFATITAQATTPLMSLDLPSVGLTLGPTWASKLNIALERVDSHNHTSGQGSRVPTAGLLINNDLSFGYNNATDLYSARFLNQSATLAGPNDRSSVSVVNGDLYFNNATGTAVKLTSGSSLNVAALGVIGGDYGGSNPASVTFSETTSTYSFLESAGIAAQMAMGRITLFEETTGAAGITLQSPSSLGAAYSLTLPTAQASNNNVLKGNSSGELSFGQVLTAEIADGAITGPKLNSSAVDGTSVSIVSNALSVTASGISTAKIADSAVTSAKIADGTIATADIADGAITPAKRASLPYSVSSDSGLLSSTGSEVTIGSVSIPTTGRPVTIGMKASSTYPNVSLIGPTSGSGVVSTLVRFKRNGTEIGIYYIHPEAGASSYLPPSGFSFFDESPGVSGSTTYSVTFQRESAGSPAVAANYIKVYALEN